MPLNKFFNESLKYLCLCFLSITYSFNYLNYIPFIIIYLRETKILDIYHNIYLLIYFIMYEVIKYFSFGLTIRINDLIGEHYYYSLSICIISVINLIFSFISFSYFNIFILIFYRIFISLFNNISSNINLPLSLFYTKKLIIFKKRNFSFIQKLTNFLFFLIFLSFYNFLTKFYIYCFISSVMNLISFILSLIIISCHKENIYNQYIPSISEKENDNSIVKTYQKGRMNNKNNDIIVDIYNNSNSVNNNISTGINNMDNLIKENKNKLNANLVSNESNKNEAKSLSQSNKDFLKVNNSSVIKGIKGIFFPFYKKSNKNLINNKERKNLINLLLVLVLSKSLNFLCAYMLLFKVSTIKIFSYLSMNYNGLIFYELFFMKFNSIAEEYIFLYMCYSFFNIVLHFINLSYTSIAFKKKFINFIFYYFSFIIYFVTSFFFVYYYLQDFTKSKLDTDDIKKRIIIFFTIDFVMNECTMIMGIFFNIFGKKKGFSEKLLKDIKTSSSLLASFIFLIIEGSIKYTISKGKISYEKYIYYIIYFLFIFIMLLISVLFLNYQTN